MKNHELAYAIYQLQGQAGVEAAVEAGLLKWDCWAWCPACESVEPIEDDSCLVCGTSGHWSRTVLTDENEGVL